MSSILLLRIWTSRVSTFLIVFCSFLSASTLCFPSVMRKNRIRSKNGGVFGPRRTNQERAGVCLCFRSRRERVGCKAAACAGFNDNSRLFHVLNLRSQGRTQRYKYYHLITKCVFCFPTQSICSLPDSNLIMNLNLTTHPTSGESRKKKSTLSPEDDPMINARRMP